MTKKRRIYQIGIALLLCFMQTAGIAMYGQNRPRAAAKRIHRLQADSLNAIRQAARIPSDSLGLTMDEPVLHQAVTSADSIATADSKYWKLPIFYGGFAGCAYALTWNGKMYKDYSTAYKDAMNGNMQSSSITDLLPPGYTVSETQLKELLRKRKDTYRRYRDLSIFAFIGVYLLSVIDAYVDAELSNFDITPDLSMKVEPTVINNQISNPSNRSVGLQCSFRF